MPTAGMTIEFRVRGLRGEYDALARTMTISGEAKLTRAEMWELGKFLQLNDPFGKKLK